jgi:hypothetical protein
MLLTDSQEKRTHRKTDLRPLLKGMYPVAFAITLIPLFEFAVGVWPFHLGNIVWRFSATGMLLKSLVVPLFGLGIASVIAAFLEQRRVMRVLAVVAMTAGVALAALLAVFVLDFLQMRSSVGPQLKAGIDKASVTAVTIGAILVPVAMGIGLGGWKVSRQKTERSDAVRSKKDVSLIVQTPPNPKESAS